MTTRCCGELLQREHRCVREEGNFADARDRRPGGAPADVDEDARRGQHLVADTHAITCLEARVALDHGAAGHAAQALLDAGAGIARHRIGARLDAAHVHAHGTVEDHAVVRPASREVGGVSAGDERLRRHATGVDAGAAEEMPLDERHCHAGRGQTTGEEGTGLAGADDDRVECSHGRALTTSAAPRYATASSINAAGWSRPKALASHMRRV